MLENQAQTEEQNTLLRTAEVLEQQIKNIQKSIQTLNFELLNSFGKIDQGKDIVFGLYLCAFWSINICIIQGKRLYYLQVKP